MTFPTVSDDSGEVYLRFEVPVQPAFVIVGSDGTTQTLAGAVDGSTLDSILNDATSAPSQSLGFPSAISIPYGLEQLVPKLQAII